MAFLTGRYADRALALISKIGSANAVNSIAKVSVPLGGQLDDDALAAFRSVASTTTLAIVLDGSDWLTCEDLGRQLRIVYRRARAEGIASHVWTGSESQDVVAAFLQRERLGGLPVISVIDPRLILGVEKSIATPAALLLAGDGSVLSGVGHPTTVRGVRAVSFVQELTWPAPVEAEGDLRD